MLSGKAALAKGLGFFENIASYRTPPPPPILEAGSTRTLDDV
jgi:hypothetical protein